MTSASSAVSTTFGVETLRGERRVDLRAAGEREVVGHDRIARDRLERERLHPRERMRLRDEHARGSSRSRAASRAPGYSVSASVAMPRSDVAARRLLGDLARVALVQHEPHLRIARGERLQHLAAARSAPACAWSRSQAACRPRCGTRRRRASGCAISRSARRAVATTIVAGRRKLTRAACPGGRRLRRRARPRAGGSAC